MAKQKKDENGVCVFCGAEGKMTDDHVPPKNLFVGFHDEGLIKVSGCKSCNGGSSKDDEYFRAFLIPQDDIASHPQAQKLNRIVREKFDASELKGLENRMYSQLHSKDVYTPAGIYLGQKPLIYPEYHRIDASLKKMLKGLFFHLMKTPFPSGLFHIAVVDKSQIGDLERILKMDLDFWVKELARYPFNDIYGVFSYKCAVCINPPPLISAWLLTFFGKREFFGLTYPKNFGSEVKLIDSYPNEIAQIRL